MPPNGELGVIIDLDPYLDLIEAALDIFELAGIIPSPIGLLLSLFAGRPKELATVQVAQRLLTARNPPARIWAIELLRGVTEWDLVISAGPPQSEILGSWFHQFVTSMVAQGVTLDRAREIATAAMSNAAQSGLPIEPELKLALPDQLQMTGPTEYSTLFNTQYTTSTNNGLTIKEALTKAEAYALKKLGLGKMQGIIAAKPIPGLQPQIPPNPDGTCPNGYQLDPTTRFCVLPSVQGGPTPNAPLPGQPEPDGDEVTSTLCAQMAADTAALIAAIQSLTPQSEAPDLTCCANVVAAIATVSQGLLAILQFLPQLIPTGSAPLDPVTCTQLTALVAQLITAGGLNAAQIADAIAAAAGGTPDPNAQLTRIADAMTTGLSDDQAYLDLLKTEQLISYDMHDLLSAELVRQ